MLCSQYPPKKVKNPCEGLAVKLLKIRNQPNVFWLVCNACGEKMMRLAFVREQLRKA